jgi:hypothetical protein
MSGWLHCASRTTFAQHLHSTCTGGSTTQEPSVLTSLTSSSFTVDCHLHMHMQCFRPVHLTASCHSTHLTHVTVSHPRALTHTTLTSTARYATFCQKLNSLRYSNHLRPGPLWDPAASHTSHSTPFQTCQRSVSVLEAKPIQKCMCLSLPLPPQAGTQGHHHACATGVACDPPTCTTADTQDTTGVLHSYVILSTWSARTELACWSCCTVEGAA